MISEMEAELIEEEVTELSNTVLTDVKVEVAVMIASAELVVSGAGMKLVGAGGGMTLKVNEAPHSSRVAPTGQHPLSVQYESAGQYSRQCRQFC